VDVAEEGKGLDLVAVDQDRRLVASRGRLAVHDVVEIVLGEIRPSIVCIDSPSGWSRSGHSRDAERQLARVGISAFATGTDPGEHRFYRWMRVGFSIFERLAPVYPLFGAGEPRGTAAEVFPHASAVLLAGGHRSGAETKVVFRRRVLRTFGVDEGALPNLDRVDAAVGALTGLLALEGCWTAVGEPTEGTILVPVVALPATRLPRTQSGGDSTP
jgi:predicted nuclease with RNAse H fold